MYSKSMDSIRTNDVISKPFILHRGAKQGCPASGLLFNLIIETLAEKIRSERILKAYKLEVKYIKYPCIVMTSSST